MLNAQAIKTLVEVGIDRYHARRHEAHQNGGDASGAYVGKLVDDWGWTIALQAEVVERDGVKVFEGTGTLTNATAGEHGTAVQADLTQRHLRS